MRISLSEAAQRLMSGEVVAIPTETVYGLAACLDNLKAVQKIYTLKSRPAKNPLIIHVASVEAINEYAKELPEGFEALGKAFWPGPLTLVLSIHPNTISKVVTADLETAAFRVPAHALTRELLSITGPLVMPSANLSGKPSATSAEHVEKDFNVDFPVLDGGPSEEGLESTILIWDEKSWVIGRLGAIDPESFLPVLGYIPEGARESRGSKNKIPICPGQMFRHYAPKAKLHLVEKVPCLSRFVILGFDDRNYPSECKIYSLGTSKSPEIAAKRLYAILRQLDEDGVEEAYVGMDFPNTGLWITIRERLKKAASG